MGRPQNIDRNAVLDAAESIVLERGAAELTIDAVAQAVGITKGGVQYCFGTKAGLIEAMLERWCREFQAEIDELTSPVSDPIAAIGGYIEATANINKLTHARAAGMMAVLLQSPEHMEGVRRWYREHLQPLDLSTPAGKKARIAFMAMEGAFLLRTFGFMQMADAEWHALFGEIKATLPALQQTASAGSRPSPAAPEKDTFRKSAATGKTSPETHLTKKAAPRKNSRHRNASKGGSRQRSTAQGEDRAQSVSPKSIRLKKTALQGTPPKDDDALPFFLF